MSALEKSIWTDADFEQMGWHDAVLYAFAVDWGAASMPEEGPWRGADLLFDLDYIVAWIEPGAPGGHYTFDVAPATLVFEDVWNVRGELDNPDNAELEVADLHRGEFVDGDPPRWTWHLEGHRFDVRFQAGGFRQYFRRWPVRVERQNLTRAERGRPSFDCPKTPPAH